MSITTYRKNIRNAVRSLWLGAISKGQFNSSMNTIIKNGLNTAFDDGASEFSIKRDEYTTEEITFIKQTISKETSMVSSFSSYIVKNNKASGGNLNSLFNRAELWVNRYKDVENRAKILTGKNNKLEWKLGSVEESCATCNKLDKKVKRASTWKNSGLEPQNPPNKNLECGGWGCQCKLTKTNKPISKGKLPKVTTVSEPEEPIEEIPPIDKLDIILEQAPDNQDDFTQFLMEKVQNGEIEYPEAVELQSRFAENKPKKPSKPTVGLSGDVPKGKIFTRKEFGDGVDKKKWTKWEGKLNNKEKKSLLDYKSEPFDDRSTSYIEINNYLRGKDKKPSKETKNAIKNIDAAIVKGSVPEDTIVYRGFKPSVLGDNIEDLVGKSITDGGYTSVSLDKEVAKKFSKELMMEIRIPKNTKGAYIDSVPVDDPDLDFENERELLLPRGSKFRILSANKDKNGVIQIVSELIL